MSALTNVHEELQLNPPQEPLLENHRNLNNAQSVLYQEVMNAVILVNTFTILTNTCYRDLSL